jgi:hypothetical protein
MKDEAMDEDEKQLDQQARDLASRINALDLYDVEGNKAVFADMKNFSADFRRVYNIED